MAEKVEEKKNFCQYGHMMSESKNRFSRGLENAQKRTSAAAWGRFNSRMSHVYNAPHKLVHTMARMSKGNEKARQFVRASSSKGLPSIDACLTWGVKILTATGVRITGTGYASGFDHAECMDKEIAHTNKGKKQGLTWSASR